MGKFVSTITILLITFSLYGQTQLKVHVSYPDPTEGRLILMISNDFSAEPRFQITDDVKSQVAAGVNIYEKSGSTSVSFPVKDQVLYPIQQWDELPEGEYQVQDMLYRYLFF